MLTKEQVQWHKKRLEEELSELNNWLEQNRFSPEDDREKYGPIEMERRARVRLAKDSRKTDIEAALKRIEDGTFGICPDCGMFIGEERLAVNSAYKRCVKCQLEHFALIKKNGNGNGGTVVKPKKKQSTKAH